ncbi:hypothetical protein EDB92DRAFT_1460233 [Lactarius akahatsu]|uniref:Uncharacterized protein n=1 Tax=Lactarius akahatsu TaxID=416441 RepID=A0AAD4Q513_9AGAM|nr:hypothetical protein EDB92DRAFT_1460233 [Lactarius akahatsu]
MQRGATHLYRPRFTKLGASVQCTLSDMHTHITVIKVAFYPGIGADIDCKGWEKWGKRMMGVPDRRAGAAGALIYVLRARSRRRTCRVLALLAQQRRRDSMPDARTRLDEFLPARLALARDLYALRERLVYNIPHDGASRRAGITGFGGFTDADGVAAERRRMWMLSEAACEGTVVASTGTAQIVTTFSCVLGSEGVFGRTLIPLGPPGSLRRKRRVWLMRWPPMAIR